jgi:hypothetical protein
MNKKASALLDRLRALMVKVPSGVAVQRTSAVMIIDSCRQS